MIYTSWSWPNMFDVSRNKINLYSDTQSITNRVKLLLLTEPTELYMNPNYGVGLKKYIFKYNNDNVIAQIRDELIEQLRLWEPGVVPEETTVERGLSSSSHNLSDPELIRDKMSKLELTITVTTSNLRKLSFGITEEDINGLE